MNQAKPERGAKRTCLNCQSRFYDLARVPAFCPKCGTEYVEIARPVPFHLRKKGAISKGRPDLPFDVKVVGNQATYEARSEGDDPEPGEEREEELDNEDEQESEAEDSEE